MILLRRLDFAELLSSSSLLIQTRALDACPVGQYGHALLPPLNRVWATDRAAIWGRDRLVPYQLNFALIAQRIRVALLCSGAIRVAVVLRLRHVIATRVVSCCLQHLQRARVRVTWERLPAVGARTTPVAYVPSEDFYADPMCRGPQKFRVTTAMSLRENVGVLVGEISCDGCTAHVYLARVAPMP